MARRALALLAVTAGLFAAASLADAGRKGDWGASEIQIQNSDFLSRPVTTTFISSIGANTAVVTRSLVGNHGDFIIPQLPAAFTGTVSIDGPSSVLGVVTHFDDNPPGAAQWALVDEVDLSDTANVPYFAALQTPGRSSRIKIHNLEPIAANVVITFYAPSGVAVHVRTNLQLPPLGAQFLTAGELGVPPLFQGSAVVQADRRIYVSVDRSSLQSYASAHAPARGGARLAAPLFFAQHMGLSSTLAVQNVSTVTATGALTYYAASSGSPLATQEFKLAPRAALHWSAPGVVSGAVGHVDVTADKPIAGLVLGDALDGSGLWDYTMPVVHPSPSDVLDRHIAYGPAVFAHYGDFGDWISQVAVANLSASRAFVTVVYRSVPVGSIVTYSRSLLPHGVAVFTEAATLPPEFQRAAVRVISDEMIAAAIFATSATDSDGYMAYEAQYAAPAPELRTYLPIILK